MAECLCRFRDPEFLGYIAAEAAKDTEDEIIDIYEKLKLTLNENQQKLLMELDERNLQYAVAVQQGTVEKFFELVQQEIKVKAACI